MVRTGLVRRIGRLGKVRAADDQVVACRTVGRGEATSFIAGASR
jgi:hypothetical protein